MEKGSDSTDTILLSPGWNRARTPRACIIGLGLIGGSWAGALARLGWTVFAVDCNEESLIAAKFKGWIKEGFTEVPEEMDVDLVILALPVSLLPESFAMIVGRVSTGAIVTDVGSIKQEICELSSLLDNVHFIGGHPMTGSEKYGFSAAHPDLFNGFPYVLTPHYHCHDAVIRAFSDLLQSLGSTVIFRDYKEHDREVALVSHVPHLMALALALSALEGFPDGKPLELAGRSFREVTRLVDSSPEMWRDIFFRNAPAVLSSLEIWEEKIQEIRGIIERLDGDGIINVFERAQQARGQILKRGSVDVQQRTGE
jgi:prephenate dehydrogenase